MTQKLLSLPPTTRALLPLALTALLGACAAPMAPTPMSTPTTPFSQADLPAAVQVPPGHRVALETVGIGDITYECRERTSAGPFEWVFVGPQASLQDRRGATIGHYAGPPATWALHDGSAVTGTQLAVAPAAPGSIPLQLVKANPATGAGMLNGITHIQRVATQGGVAPAMACDASAKGKREVVRYRADYIFWRQA